MSNTLGDVGLGAWYPADWHPYPPERAPTRGELEPKLSRIVEDLRGRPEIQAVMFMLIAEGGVGFFPEARVNAASAIGGFRLHLLYHRPALLDLRYAASIAEMTGATHIGSFTVAADDHHHGFVYD